MSKWPVSKDTGQHRLVGLLGAPLLFVETLIAVDDFFDHLFGLIFIAS